MAGATEALVRETVVRDNSDLGQGGSHRNGSRVIEGPPEADRDVWQKAYEEALDRGAGRNVASFFANQRLRRLRETRDGIKIPGARDYAAYR